MPTKADIQAQIDDLTFHRDLLLNHSHECRAYDDERTDEERAVAARAEWESSAEKLELEQLEIELNNWKE